MAESSMLAYFAKENLPPVVRKGWFKHEFVRVGDYMRSAQTLFEMGVAIGYVCRDQIKICVQLFSPPGQEAKVLSSLEKSAASQLGTTGILPQDFLDLFFKAEAERIMQQLREAGVTRCSQWSEFPKIAKKELELPEALSAFEGAIRKGLAFGSHYPKLAENLAARAPEPETWNLLQARATKVPDAPSPVQPMDLRAVEASALLREYVETHRADLLLPLGLWPQDTHDTRLRLRALLARQRHS